MVKWWSGPCYFRRLVCTHGAELRCTVRGEGGARRSVAVRLDDALIPAAAYRALPLRGGLGANRRRAAFANADVTAGREDVARDVLHANLAVSGQFGDALVPVVAFQLPDC